MNWLMIEGLLLFALAQTADIWTTERVLAAGGRELNPVVRFLMEQLGRGWISVKLAVAAVVVGIALYTGTAWLAWISGALTALVAFRNWRLLQ